MRHKQSGFTLVEIAIVLVIIGLLLGGILKGQELVANARVRNVADQQNSIKAAYYAFQDRYRALPGDYRQANQNIPNVASSANGNGDAQITGSERVWAWHHLTNAGFISCAECAKDPGANPTPSVANSVVNAYDGVMEIIYDATYAGNTSSLNNLKSGAQIPSNVLAEVDRKIDDGNPNTGTLRFTNYGLGATPGACTGTDANSVPIWAAGNPAPVANCEAANLL
jgi:prepilin-type N-terminal cleavage/methylation domain-containing protein